MTGATGGVLGLGPLLRMFRIEEAQRTDTRAVTVRFTELVRYGLFVDETVRRSKVAMDDLRAAETGLGRLVKRGDPSSKDDPQPLWDELEPALTTAMEAQRLAVTIAMLEIESFYMFAKILLDRWSMFVEAYFGKQRKCSLESHDRLSNNIADYVAAKGLGPLSPRLRELIPRMRTRISDYRDFAIAHDKSPGVVRVVIGGVPRIAHIEISGQWGGGKAQGVSGSPESLLVEVNEYLSVWIDFLRNNRSKSVIGLKPPPGVT